MILFSLMEDFFLFFFFLDLRRIENALDCKKDGTVG